MSYLELPLLLLCAGFGLSAIIWAEGRAEYYRAKAAEIRANIVYDESDAPSPGRAEPPRERG